MEDAANHEHDWADRRRILSPREDASVVAPAMRAWIWPLPKRSLTPPTFLSPPRHRREARPERGRDGTDRRSFTARERRALSRESPNVADLQAQRPDSVR